MFSKCLQVELLYGTWLDGWTVWLKGVFFGSVKVKFYQWLLAVAEQEKNACNI